MGAFEWKKVIIPALSSPSAGIHSLPTLTTEGIKALDYSHAFREIDMQTILKKMLVERQAVNIFGEKGIGKKRLLQDILRLNIPHYKVLIMKVWQKYELTMQPIAQGLGLAYNPTQSIGQMAEQASEREGKRIVLLFEEIDDLYDEAKQNREGYDAFFSQLNGLKNSDYCHVACLTTLPKGSHYKTVGSPLSWHREEIDLPTLVMMKQEVKRRKPALPIPLVNDIASQCNAEPQPYTLLEHLLTKKFKNQNELHQLIRTYRKQRT